MENFCGCIHFLLYMGKVLQLCGLSKKYFIIKSKFAGKLARLQGHPWNHESFPPRMICIIRYNTIFQFISFMLLFIAVQLTNMLSDKKFLPSKDPQVDQLWFVNNKYYTTDSKYMQIINSSGFAMHCSLPTITITIMYLVSCMVSVNVLLFHGNQHTINNNNNTLHSLLMVFYQWIIHYTQY